MIVVQWILAVLCFLVGSAILVFGTLPMAALVAHRGYGSVAFMYVAFNVVGLVFATWVAFNLLPWVSAVYGWVTAFF